MPRIVKHPEERRGELIACARELFYTKGFEKTSINDIVDAIGVAKGTFYYYFESKQAVLEAMVGELVEQLTALLRTVTRDERLDAASRWTMAFQVINNWKVGRKVQMLAMARVMMRPENVRLLQKVRTTATPKIISELSRIIRQGVAEGVFTTPFQDEAAAHCFAIMEVLSYALRDLLLEPERHEDPLTLATRKVAAAQHSIEILLGASQGSLPVVDREVLEAWFN